MSLSVLMVTPIYYPFVGGLERQAHTLSKELVRLGLKVTVVTGRYDPDLPRREEIGKVIIHRLPFSRHAWLRGFTFLPMLSAFLISNARKYDVIHLHGFGWYLLAVTPIAKILKVPILLKFPSAKKGGLSGIGKRRLKNVLLRIVKSPDAFVSISDEITEELLTGGISKSRIFKAFNGVDTILYRPPMSKLIKTKLREQLLLPEGKLCLFTGRFVPEKGLADLFAIWPEIVKEIPDAHLILCGTGPQEAALRALSNLSGIEVNIHFTGYIENTADYYKAADIFVLPSYREGNSNSILEAMASGLPVVSALAGGTPALVGCVGADYLVTPGDRLSLLKILSGLLTNEAKIKELGVEFQKRAEMLSIEKSALHYIKGYKLLASKQLDKIGNLVKQLDS